jgi:DNA-binding transcriptional ArsR family regulator
MCGEIVEEMPLAQSTVSQHLKILKETGLVQGEIDGPRVCYCINKAAMAKLKKLLADLKPDLPRRQEAAMQAVLFGFSHRLSAMRDRKFGSKR